MSKHHLFLAAFLLFLFQLPPTTSSHCDRHDRSICMKQDTVVPGHTYIGQGVDITTLERKGAFVVDTSQWQGPNGTCILCRNHLMNGQLQKLPLAVADWQIVRSCHGQDSSSVEHLDVDVANAMATEVKNDWKADLGLGTEMYNAGLHKVAFAGSHFRMAIDAHKKSQRDSYSFVRQEFSCIHYRLRLRHRPSPLSSHFAQHVAELPIKNNSEEYQHFIDSYGTHYISHVELGARVRQLLAVQTCKMALWGITASRIKDCLNWEFSLGRNGVFGSASQNAKCEKILKFYSHGVSHDEAYAKRHTEVVGGDKLIEMLFSKDRGTQLFSAWIDSAKATPGLVSYSLLPLHMLLDHQDPRRGLLKQAIASHIKRKALKRDCPQRCPRWSSQSSGEQCTCLCPKDGLNDNMCCARERGRAHLTFVVTKGANLWGDNHSPTDAYVRVVFQGRALTTRIITSDNPRWDETLGFGTVTLKHENPFHIEVWDTDGWRGDELLQRCTSKLEASAGAQYYTCSPQYGYIEFHYFLECGHTLSGPTCQDYVPLQLPTSYFN